MPTTNCRIRLGGVGVGVRVLRREALVSVGVADQYHDRVEFKQCPGFITAEVLPPPGQCMQGYSSPNAAITAGSCRLRPSNATGVRRAARIASKSGARNSSPQHRVTKAIGAQQRRIDEICAVERGNHKRELALLNELDRAG